MLSFKNKQSFFQKIDSLPHGPSWVCETFQSTGDELDEEGHRRVEYLELWKRNPLDCIQELLGNPAFREHMHFASEQIFEDILGENRMYNEMWTAEWWEDLQVRQEWQFCTDSVLIY